MMKANKSARKAIEDSLRDDIRSISSGARDQLSKPAERYLRYLVDPKREKACKVPTLLGGFPRSTRVVPVKAQLTIKTSTAAGFGFAIINPNHAGPFSDRDVGSFSSLNTSTISGTTVPPSTYTTGVTAWRWNNAPFVAASNVTGARDFRCVGCAAYITPTSALLDQGGKIYILETYGHQNLGSSFDAAKGSDATRMHSGVVSRGSEELVLNWHPQMTSGSVTPGANEFAFNPGYTAANSGNAAQGGLLIWVETTADQTVEVEIYAAFEVRGTAIQGGTFSPVDERGMDLVFNTIGSKRLSGWFGTPNQAQHSYLTTAWHFAKKFGRLAKRELMKVERGGSDAVALAKGVAGLLTM